MFGLGKKPLVEIELPPNVYDEIALRLIAAQQTASFQEGVLDMNGIGLVRAKPEPAPVHRPIAGKKKNTAPGAI